MLFPPIVKFLANCAQRELAAQAQYLKSENEILRRQLPKRLSLTPREKSRLVRLEAAIRDHIKELVSVCTPATFLRWMRAAEQALAPAAATQAVPLDPTAGAPKRKPGRPRTPEDLRKLIIKMADETGWGYTPPRTGRSS